jgi:hypothetical protein
MVPSQSFVSGVVIGAFVAAEAEVAEGEEVRGVWGAGFEAVQAASEEERVVGEVVVQVVVD